MEDQENRLVRKSKPASEIAGGTFDTLDLRVNVYMF
jgi:hypothetical protein